MWLEKPIFSFVLFHRVSVPFPFVPPNTRLVQQTKCSSLILHAKLTSASEKLKNSIHQITLLELLFSAVLSCHPCDRMSKLCFPLPTSAGIRYATSLLHRGQTSSSGDGSQRVRQLQALETSAAGLHHLHARKHVFLPMSSFIYSLVS